MMLLTAVILIIGFIALAGMAGRVAQLPEKAVLDRQDIFFDEADRVVDGIQQALDVYPSCDAMDLAGLEDTMVHMQFVEGGRGFALWSDVGCSDGSPAVTFRLASETAAIQGTVVGS